MEIIFLRQLVAVVVVLQVVEYRQVATEVQMQSERLVKVMQVVLALEHGIQVVAVAQVVLV
jgi:hypothetical protein